MLKRTTTKAVEKFLEGLPDKQFCQLYDSIESLRGEPEPADSAILKGSAEPQRRRKDVGEYRVIYWHDAETLYIDLIGKRNDDAVYRAARRKGII